MNDAIKRNMLKRIKEIYDNGGNIMQYLRNGNANSKEDILISYDFQAGSYNRNHYANPELTYRICKEIIGYFEGLDGEKRSLLEAGVGEGTILVNIAKMWKNDLVWMGG